MYLLDTNALYSYVGREKLGLVDNKSIDEVKLKSFLDKRDDKAISATAFVEALVYNRDKKDKLSILQSFLLDNNIRLYNNIQYLGFGTKEYTSILEKSKEKLSQYVNEELVRKKIDLEYAFSLIFYETILLLYLRFVMSQKGISEEAIIIAAEQVKTRTLKDVRLKLKRVYDDAYQVAVNAEEDKIKKGFVSLLECGCIISDKLADMIIELKKGGSDDELRTIEKAIEAEYNCMAKDVLHGNYLMDRIDKAFQFDKKYIKYAEERISEMFSARGKAFINNQDYAFGDFQVNYLKEKIFPAWFEQRQKFRKNDIFDFFFLKCADYREQTQCVLQYPYAYLMCFDKKMMDYISLHRPENGKVIKSFMK